MTTSIEMKLQDAFDLIEADQLEKARSLLRPMLETEKNNPDVWWVFAHAVTDSESARLALLNVLSLDSNYPGVQELLAALEKRSGRGQELTDEELATEPPFVPVLPDSLPDTNGTTSVLGDTAAVRQDELASDTDEYNTDFVSKSVFQRPVVYVPLLLLLILAALAIVVIRPFQQALPDNTTQTPNNVSLVPTLESFTVPDVTASIDDDLAQSILVGMSDFALPESPVQSSQTQLGSTIIVSVCTKAGRELRVDLPRAMLSLARTANEVAGEFDAIAARMVDCDTNTELRAIGAMMSDANGFVAGTLDQAQFEATWLPVVL